MGGGRGLARAAVRPGSGAAQDPDHARADHARYREIMAPCQALSRVIWASSVQNETGMIIMGLEFQEITNKDRDLITQYIIRAQMPA